MKIKKILIANRGEIACRVIRSARAMGIKTVAVYSDADASAKHVREADEAVHIGPSPAAESYLVQDKILGAAKETGADAIHPGYGFLSENASFARACAKAGIIFIGPKAESIEAMGLKDAAKALMAKAGVPVTPGYHGENQDADYLKVQADEIGYPVLIKAVAGGGGKGMRKVDEAKSFLAALESCRREAKASFDDDNVLIEKYISNPRHIEVQIFGDAHGNAIHLFERDCSLQRRHQKVIEEAPAPGMTEEVRAAMTDAAVKAALAVNYEGAGTVEFIVDGSGPLRADGFWFMEMNTRLQVEHPVTEMITGMDLVELQIRVAQGEKLPAQKSLSINGHAFEARLYAEDPQKDFAPSIGPLTRLYLPEDTARIDTGVEQGDEVSIFYDPMISKIITHDSTRAKALAALEDALDETEVWPVKTNAGFLTRCLASKDFRAGDVSTHFIGAHEDTLFSPVHNPAHIRELAASLEYMMTRRARVKGGTPWDSPEGWRLNAAPRFNTAFMMGEDRFDVRLSDRGDHFVIRQGSDEGNVRVLDFTPDRGLATGTIAIDPSGNAKKLSARYMRTNDVLVLFADGETYDLRWPNPAAALAAVTGGDGINAPMPGKIIAVKVAAGDTVKQGDPVIIMEAMKMEMTLDAPRDGEIDEIKFETGELVGDGDLLVTLK